MLSRPWLCYLLFYLLSAIVLISFAQKSRFEHHKMFFLAKPSPPKGDKTRSSPMVVRNLGRILLALCAFTMMLSFTACGEASKPIVTPPVINWLTPSPSGISTGIIDGVNYAKVVIPVKATQKLEFVDDKSTTPPTLVRMKIVENGVEVGSYQPWVILSNGDKVAIMLLDEGDGMLRDLSMDFTLWASPDKRLSFTADQVTKMTDGKAEVWIPLTTGVAINHQKVDWIAANKDTMVLSEIHVYNDTVVFDKTAILSKWKPYADLNGERLAVTKVHLGTRADTRYTDSMPAIYVPWMPPPS